MNSRFTGVATAASDRCIDVETFKYKFKNVKNVKSAIKIKKKTFVGPKRNTAFV